MTNTTIVVASDHRGFKLKSEIIKYLKTININAIDYGTSSTEKKVDYPKYAQKTAQAIQQQQAEYGILICGSGTGMAIAANRFKGVRAAICFNKEYAQIVKQHNHANIMIFGANYITTQETLDCIKIFLGTKTEDKYMPRIDMLDNSNFG